MNESEHITPVSDEHSALIASLQRQVTVLLLALIVVSGTLTVYLFYQSLILGRQLAVAEPQARVAFENYQKNWLPQAQKLVNELGAYSQEHPGFKPILKKYGLSETPSAATNAPPPR